VSHQLPRTTTHFPSVSCGFEILWRRFGLPLG
jgi:hypothetical protein